MPIFTAGGSQVGSANIVDNSIVNADINTAANIDPSKLGAGPMDVIADVTLGGAAVEISSGTIAAYERLKVILYVPSFTTVSEVFVRYNNDTGANYNYATVTNSDAPVAAAGVTSTRFQSNGNLGQTMLIAEIINVLALPKIHSAQGYQDPNVTQSAGRWNNTIAQITEIDIFSTNNFPTGTRLIVMGAKLS